MLRNLNRLETGRGTLPSTLNLIDELPVAESIFLGRERCAGSLLILYPVIVFVLVAVVGHVLLTRTCFGWYVFSIGCNERAVRYSGIRVDRVKLGVYGLVVLAFESELLTDVASRPRMCRR